MPRAPLAALLLVLALAPPAAAHLEGHIPHVNPFRGTLPPGEVEIFDLAFEEGPFEAGWVFLVNGIVYEGAAAPLVELTFNNETVASWTIAPGQQTRHLTARMPHNGFYGLRVSNPTPQNLTVGFFYDQSCNCVAKPIPVEVPNGLVVFNADAQRGATWKATFPEPAVHTLKVSLAKRVDERSQWPQDFQVLQTSAQAQVRDVGAGPVRLHELTWTADETARYYFFVESTRADLDKFDFRNPVPGVMVQPLFEQLGAASKPAPGLDVAWLLAAAAMAGLAARRLRP